MLRSGIVAGLFLLPLVSVSAQEVDTAAARFEASLSYATGTVVLGKQLATINIPSGFRFLGPADAKRLLEDAWGNPPGSDPLGMLVPAEASPLSKEGWGVVITFEEDGHVKDDDAKDINYAELLKEMQHDAQKANAERVKKGYDRVYLMGWAEPPHYDQAAHKLYWAKELQFGDEETRTLNYSVRILGRRGVLVLNAVASMDQLSTVHAEVGTLLPAVDFNAGHRYTDFVPRADKVAAYGIAGLIAGKIAVKVGLFKVILGVLIAAKKAIVVGLVAVGAFFKKLFSRKTSATQNAA